MEAFDPLAFLVLGAAGSLHCLGMCGGLAVAAVRGHASGRTALADTLLFAVGKASTYVVLGGALAAATHLLLEHTQLAALEELRRGLAWVTGGLLILSGTWMALRRPLRGVPWLSSVRIVELASLMRRLEGRAGVFGAGAVTGLLPCGLSWSAMLLATQQPPVSGALGLFVFGLATTPGLLIAVVGWNHLRATMRTRAQTVLGLVVVGLGVVTLQRATFDPVADPSGACCGWGAGGAAVDAR